MACMRANLRYGKNQKREDVKSHHYIISFDPKDENEEIQEEKKYERNREGRRNGLLASVIGFRCRALCASKKQEDTLWQKKSLFGRRAI